MKSVIPILVILTVSGMLPVSACTIFKTTQQGTTLIGNNEDWSATDTKVWFLAPTANEHGRILFGFGNGWAQGGMNDQGLFFDGIAGRAQQWAPDSQRQDFPGNLCEKIIAEGSTVADAIEAFEQYNVPSLVTGTLLFVDASGQTVRIYFANNKLCFDRSDKADVAAGYHERKARNLLRETRDHKMSEIAAILKACRQDGAYPTQYANVYDPQALKIYLYTATGSLDTVTFDLRHELSRGNHYFDLPLLAQQLDGELLVDHKTCPVHNTSSATLAACAGEYDLEGTGLVLVQTADGLRLRSPIVFDAVLAFDLVPIAPNVFSGRHLALNVTIIRGENNEPSALSLIFNGRTYYGQRLR